MNASFTLEGEPVAKSRPKVEIRFKPDGTPYPHVYTPDKTADAEEALAWAFKAENPGWEPLTGPVHIHLTFSSNLRRTADWDNYAKTVCDALNGIAWVDDRQIVSADVEIVRPTIQPQTHVWIRELEG